MKKVIKQITNEKDIQVKQVYCKGFYASIRHLLQEGWVVNLILKKNYYTVHLYNPVDNVILKSYSLKAQEYFNWKEGVVCHLKAFAGVKKVKEKDLYKFSNERLLEELELNLAEPYQKYLKTYQKDNVANITEAIEEAKNDSSMGH